MEARRVLKFFKSHPILSMVFAIALVVTALFLVRFAVSTIVWSDPDPHQQPIAGWMTPRYVARSRQVQPEIVADALGLGRDGTGRRLTLDEIAVSQDRSLEELRLALEAAVRDARSETGD
ncbi:hypothetical protein [Roseitranquillus sediminis]|uniref:hypothetical protein n=1 Tax=Roseitranquillus sediminis TaxID=2809051 RepID=UPI001D0C1245|nr:hypothetical protein [Roseitranquillus sediminis]